MAPSGPCPRDPLTVAAYLRFSVEGEDGDFRERNTERKTERQRNREAERQSQRDKEKEIVADLIKPCPRSETSKK